MGPAQPFLRQRIRSVKITHIYPDLSEEAAGPAYTVPRLAEGLADRGHDVEISCVAAGPHVRGVKLDVHPAWPGLRRFWIAPGHTFALRAKARSFDVIHNHSLWSMVNMGAGIVGTGGSALFVCSPRGTLSDWALGYSRRKKKIFWPLQKQALSRAGLLHATSMDELSEIRALGFRAPVAVVANGVDIPNLAPRSVPSGKTLLFLGRLHPKKGIDLLLEAWGLIANKHPDWSLQISGPGEKDHVTSLVTKAAALGLDRCHFTGPVYGEAKAATYRAADLFVLPTHSENFGMAVAEALAHGLPAVVSKGAPWSGLEHEGAGWWVGNDVPTLAATLDHAMAVPGQRLVSMGARGRAWMERDFGWAAIANQMEAAYLFARGHAPRPDWVDV